MFRQHAIKTILVCSLLLQWSLTLAHGGELSPPKGMSGPKSSASSETIPSSTKEAMSTIVSALNATNGGLNATNSSTKASPLSKAAQRLKEKHQDMIDWQMIRGIVYLWIGLFILMALALISIMLHRYLRLISCLSPGNNQAYFATVWKPWGWLKKHFLLAPLGKKRHHREFKLMSTLHGGSLPSRAQTTMIVTYFVVLTFLTVYDIDYSDTRHEIMTELTKRSGILALANMVPLFLLAARNNPLIAWTGVTFDTFNLLHRWIGRFVVFETIVHVAAYMTRKIESQGWAGFQKSWNRGWFIRSGVITAFCMFLIFLQSPSPVRHAFYETFLHLHQALVAVVVWGIYVHMDGYSRQRMVVKGIIAIWVLEVSCYTRS
jgi:hypothetical protein